MKRIFLLVLLAAFILVPSVSLLNDSNVDAATEYHIQGYVGVPSVESTPLEGVTVTVEDGRGSEYNSSVVTDSSGFFNITTTSNTGLAISFDITGYTISSFPGIPLPRGTTSVPLDLTKFAYNSTNQTYTITGNVDNGQCVMMVNTEGKITGRVTYSDGPVKDATVTFTPVSGGSSFSTGTDNGGYYSGSLPTGLYYLTVSRQGFDPSDSYQVNITEGQVATTQDIMMKKANIGTHFGMDTPHILMLIGVVVGILMAVATWFLRKRLNGPNRVEIFDDNEDNEEFRTL